MKYPYLFNACLFFFSLAIPQSECFSEEYYVIGTADSVAKQEPNTVEDPYASSHGFVIHSPNGVVLKYGDELPKGYLWLPENRLQLPAGVVLEKNGVLSVPDNEYPEQYEIQPDGSVTAPNGFILKPNHTEKSEKPEKSEKSPASAEIKEPTIEELLDFDKIFAEEKAADDAKKKGKKSKPVAKKDKKPVSVADKDNKKLAPASKPKKKGDKFEIPDTAYKDKNLDFLEGCWKSDTYLAYTWGTGKQFPVYAKFCFDKSGRGQRTIYEKGDEYKGAITAYIKNNKLHIKTGRAYGSWWSFRHYTPLTIDCDGCGQSTGCRDFGVNPDNPKDTHTRNIVLHRE